MDLTYALSRLEFTTLEAGIYKIVPPTPVGDSLPIVGLPLHTSFYEQLFIWYNCTSLTVNVSVWQPTLLKYISIQHSQDELALVLLLLLGSPLCLKVHFYPTLSG